MKQLKRLHLSSLVTTEMGKLWGGYDDPITRITTEPLPGDNTRVTTRFVPRINP